jgi:DNA gyrase subunit A
VRGDEQLRRVVAATSQDYLLCVSSTGRVCQIAAHRIPVGTRSVKGESMANLLELQSDEEVVAMLPVDVYDEDRYLLTFSKLGKVKKSPLSEYKTADVDGIQDMKLLEGDSVVAALISRGSGDYLVTADNALTLRFSDEQLRAQGRFGQGVAAISLSKGAVVLNAAYVDNELNSQDIISLLAITTGGMGKRVALGEFAVKGRATVGITTIELQSGDMILQTMLVRDDETILLTVSGDAGEKGERVVSLRSSKIPVFPRNHKGSCLAAGRVMNAVVLA